MLEVVRSFVFKGYTVYFRSSTYAMKSIDVEQLPFQIYAFEPY